LRVEVPRAARVASVARPRLLIRRAEAGQRGVAECENESECGGGQTGHFDFAPVRGLPKKTNAPSSVPVTMSFTPSLFRSTATICDPAPDALWTSSGENSAPPGAVLLRTVL